MESFSQAGAGLGEGLDDRLLSDGSNSECTPLVIPLSPGTEKLNLSEILKSLF